MGNCHTEGCTPSDAPKAELQQVQLALTEIFCVFGVPAYHSSVLLNGREYYFDSNGVHSAPPFWSHGGPRNLADAQGGAEAGAPSSSWDFMQGCKTGCVIMPKELQTRVIVVGNTRETEASMLQALSPFFAAGSYDMLHKNCNTFADLALSFLTYRRLNEEFTRLERMLLAAEPLSAGLLNQLLRAASGAKDDADDDADYGELVEYVGNPVAQGFSVESVLTLLGIEAEGSPKATPLCQPGGLLGCSQESCGRACAPSAVPTEQDNARFRTPLGENQAQVRTPFAAKVSMKAPRAVR